MQALVTTGLGQLELKLAEVADPRPGSAEALVALAATSLNAGEVRGIADSPAGTVLGWDVAGTVVEAADDGSGPAPGTRVVGLVSDGAWAQRVAVPTSALATIPDSVTFAEAATLPVAGLTAWRALELGGLLLRRRVLVTGGAGGVGRIAIQLAHRAGAHVTAVVGRPERAHGLQALGADSIVIGIETAHDTYDVVLESVGGPSLTHALNHLAEQGILVTYGRSAHETATIGEGWFATHSGASMHGLLVFTQVAQRRLGTEQLTKMLQLIADRQLDPQVSLEVSWRDAAAAARTLLDRNLAGKAVLHVD